MTLTVNDLVWQSVAHDAVTVPQLYALLQLRCEVFVVEQNCPFQDIDGLDLKAVHLMGWAAQSLVAYARCLPAGAKYAQASIGRVVTHSSLRGGGAGPELMHRAIDCVQQRWGAQAICIDAQAHLVKFYNQLGFVEFGEGYVEDGIPHIAMKRP
jgi:ElaA protein